MRRSGVVLVAFSTVSSYQQAYQGRIPAAEARCRSRRSLLVLDAPGERLLLQLLLLLLLGVGFSAWSSVVQ